MADDHFPWKAGFGLYAKTQRLLTVLTPTGRPPDIEDGGGVRKVIEEVLHTVARHQPDPPPSHRRFFFDGTPIFEQGLALERVAGAFLIPA
jgi:hypothetical protein